MKLEMYAVFDSAVGAYNQPLFFRSKGEALRSFADAVADTKNGFFSHPEHYSFYHVGAFDMASGMCDDAKVPLKVCEALDFMPPKAQEG